MRKTKTLLLALSLGLSMSAYAAELVFPTGAVVAFSADGGANWEYHTQDKVDTPYVFEAQSGKTGKIVFNPAITGNIPIKNDFQLKGSNFEIKTAANQTVSFEQPLSNQGTSVTLTGLGTVETQGAAAFANITVNSGATMKVNSQIGVTGRFNVKAGGQLELGSNAQLLLTDQIKNDGFINLYPGSKLDASNLSPGASDRLGIQFESFDENGEPIVSGGSGFLYGGTDEDGKVIQTTISSGIGHVTVKAPEPGSDLKVAQLQVGSLSFDIKDGGIVEHPETDYSVWFQNGGTSPGLSEIEKYVTNVFVEHPADAPLVTFMATRGDGAQETTLVIDESIFSGSPLVITLGTKGNLTVSNRYAGAGTIKIYEKADVTVTGWGGNESHLNDVTFIGQGITLSTAASPLGNEFKPLNILVENASGVTIHTTVHSPYGYFNGDDFRLKWAKEDGDTSVNQYDFKSGEYVLKGTLTVGDGGTLDLRGYSDDSHYVSATRNKGAGTVKNVTYQEEFSHLTMTKEGKLTVQGDGVLLASSVTDDSPVDGGNLVTARILPEGTYRRNEDGSYHIFDLEGNEIADPDTLTPYTVNGTVEIRDIKDWTKVATITADEGEAAAHYTSRNYNFTVADADINVVDEYVTGYEEGKDEKTGYPIYTPIVVKGDTSTTISNALIGDSVTNSKVNGGTVTLDNAANQDFNVIYAKEGDIAITNRETVEHEFLHEPMLEPVNAKTVHIGAGKTVSVSGTLAEAAAKATLNVTNLLQADGYKGNDPDEPSFSVVDANLRLGSGATLNVAAANGIGGIDMNGNTVTFPTNPDTQAEGAMLFRDDYNVVMGMATGSKYDLFWNVSGVDLTDFGLISPYPFTENDEYTYDASLYFTNLPSDNFYLCYSGEEIKGGNGENVGTIYIYKYGDVTPEPTTGTLSLLALAGLAARRRRK